MSTKGKLVLIPCLLGGDDTSIVSPQLREYILSINHFVVENLREARRFLKKVDRSIVIDDLFFEEIPKRKEEEHASRLLKACWDGHDVGLISDAGCPGVADPGALIVREAHRQGVSVKPLVGASSILLALMASGLDGQCFAFHGYLSREKGKRKEQIKGLEKDSVKKRQTQLFIETPYRNNQLLQDLMDTLTKRTLLTVAVDLSLETEEIITKPVQKWKEDSKDGEVDFHKRPAIFLFLG